MLKKILMCMECSRVFSLPMTILSWLVVFVYSAIDSGNIFYGMLTLVGLCFAHLGTNLLDDYFDYKALIKQVGFDKGEYLKNSQKTKCRYLINGFLSEHELLIFTFSNFAVALFVGIFLYIKCGMGVFYFALAGAIIVLLYSFLSRICLAEVAVALAYGPALFGGVYYVMTGTYSNEVYLLCLPTTLMTVVLLYIHTVMDYEYDKHEGKITLANRFDSRLDSLVVLKWLLICAYLSVILLCVFDITDWQIFAVYITLPLAFDLYSSMRGFACNPDKMPEKKWYHFPMEQMAVFEKRGAGAFMARMLQSRNLMIYFSLFLTLGLILSFLI